MIRVRQLKTSRVADGIPNTGDEQAGFSIWCGDQTYSYIVNVTECLREDELHPDSQGYVTLAVSPKDQRPVIDGKPYADWIEHPGQAGAIFREEFGTNPKTYPQSGHYLPADMGMDPNVAWWADTVQGAKKRPQMKQHMGEYYPQVYYCTKEKFEAGQCHPKSGATPGSGVASGG